MATVIIIGGGVKPPPSGRDPGTPFDIPKPTRRGRGGEEEYHESDVAPDRMVDELMRREDEASEEAAKRHDRGLQKPFGLRPISRRMGR